MSGISKPVLSTHTQTHTLALLHALSPSTPCPLVRRDERRGEERRGEKSEECFLVHCFLIRLSPVHLKQHASPHCQHPASPEQQCSPLVLLLPLSLSLSLYLYLSLYVPPQKNNIILQFHSTIGSSLLFPSCVLTLPSSSSSPPPCLSLSLA